MSRNTGVLWDEQYPRYIVRFQRCCKTSGTPGCWGTLWGLWNWQDPRGGLREPGSAVGCQRCCGMSGTAGVLRDPKEPDASHVGSPPALLPRRGVSARPGRGPCGAAGSPGAAPRRSARPHPPSGRQRPRRGWGCGGNSRNGCSPLGTRGGRAVPGSERSLANLQVRCGEAEQQLG